MNGIDWLSTRWRKAGLKNGDTVLLHSNVVRTLALLMKEGLNPSLDDILDSFLAAVGSSGTLLLPLFNFEFTNKVTFDILNTPSHMGALTEVSRKRKNAIRTGHPIYSFAVIGNKSEMFIGLDNYSGYGEDSPFGILRKLNGKIAILDIEDNKCMTFYHHVEELCQVPYRYSKKFTGKYIDYLGLETERTYAIYVRNLEMGVETSVNRMGELLWKENLYIGERPNINCGLRVGEANKIFKFVKATLDQGNALENLYVIRK